MVHRRKGKVRLTLKIFFLISISFSSLQSIAQPISLAMQFPNPVRENDSNGVYLTYSNLFYFRDYEYFNDIQTGYTLFGTWNYPRIVIQPNSHLRIETGILLQKDFGDRGLNRAEPMFSLQYQYKNFRLIAGAMEGNQTHGLIEPLMSYDKVIERPVEEGLQLKFSNRRVRADIWLDWDLRQKENSNFPEELTGGLSTTFVLTKPGKPFQVEIPMGFIMPHKGGQLDTNSSVVTSVFNKSFGLAGIWNNPGKNKLITQAKADIHYAGYKLLQDQSIYPYSSGSGFLANVRVRSKWDLSLAATYWKGKKFIAPRGGKIYQSITSITGKVHNEPERQLLFLNLIYETELLPNLFVDGRYTPYFDLDNHLLEHSFLVLLSYRTNFRLCKLKK
jgi:hypothetical protein